jgi:pimeloyl-ACP methyl ester carboxylesterase
MSEIKNGGVSIYYEAHGEGPAVLLSHGYGASHRMWEPQIEALSRDHKLITWDMRGHANSDSPDDEGEYNAAKTVEDMRLILDTEGVDRAVIGGLSLGGYMSLVFWLEQPQMTAGLLLCDTGPGYRNPDSRAGWNKMAFAQAERYRGRGLDGLPEAEEVQVSANLHRSPEGLARAATGMLAQFDSRVIDGLGSMNVPALIILGEHDTPFLKGSEAMKAMMPQAELVILKDAGHASNMDQPEAFNGAVLEFLARVYER